MTARIWIKLYLETLEDPNLGLLTDTLWRRLVELSMIAGRTGSDGALPPLEALAWSLRIDKDKLLQELHSLTEVGALHEALPGAWVVTGFAERQAPVPVGERVRSYRARQKEVTERYINDNGAGVADSTSTSESNSDSLEEERVQGEEKPTEMPRSPAEAIVHPDVRVYQAVTGRIPGLGQYRSVVEAVRLMRAQKRVDDAALAAYLEPFWHAWTGSVRRDGRPYDRANLSWLTEWALNGTLPRPSPGSAAETAEVIRAVARRMR